MFLAVGLLGASLAGAFSSSKALAEKGTYYLQTGQFDLAIEKFLAYHAEKPDDPLVYNYLGTSYYALGDVEKAREYFEQSYAALPDFWYAPYCLGCINLVDYKNWLKAQTYYEAALAGKDINEEENRAFLVKYNLLMTIDEIAEDVYGEGDEEEAIKLCREMLGLCDDLEALYAKNPKIADKTVTTNAGFMPMNSKDTMADIRQRRKNVENYLSGKGE